MQTTTMMIRFFTTNTTVTMVMTEFPVEVFERSVGKELIEVI